VIAAAKEIRFVDANGCRFAYLEWGEGEPIIVLHGFPDGAHTWDVIGPGLAEAGLHAIAPFLRGYAPSAIPLHDTDARTLGEDLLALMASFQARKVIGHDWGAESVYAAAGIAPDRFDRLITIAIPHRGGLAPTPSLAWGLRHVIAFKLPGAVKRYAKNDFAIIGHLYRRWSPTWHWTEEDLRPVKHCFSAPGSWNAALGYYRATTFATPEFMRGKVAISTLSIAGADDPVASTPVFEKARRHYTGRYEVGTIPGGHFCHRESPRAFLDLAIPFLR
jgi:pimeloyl-ACP methyl ester carboxylesterase